MAKRFALLSVLFLCILTVVPVSNGQERPKPGVTTKDVRQPQKAADAEPSIAPDSSQSSTVDSQLNQTLLLLTQQISVLTQELKKMRQDSERNATILELLLSEERLLRFEDRVAAALNNKAQLDAREQEILRRQKNIPQEVTMRGNMYSLRRDEAEAAIRLEFQRGLEETRAQQASQQAKINEMQAEADRLRYRTDLLRQKAQRLEVRFDESSKPQNKE